MSKAPKHNPYLDEPQDFASMDVSDDYEGVVEGEDGEFYYSEKKQKRVQTKDEQLYGIWADDEWDGEDGRHNKKTKMDRDKSNRIAKPMAFVSSGIIQPGQEENKIEEKMDEKDQEMQEEDESTRAARLAAERLQARSKQRKKEKGDNSSRARNSTPPTTFVPPKLDKEFASFTQHTTGFGLKMLQKFGFAGRLGKNEQGIANPITAKVRPKGMGFGFGDFKETEGEEFARNAAEEEKNAKAKEEAKAKETKSAVPDTSASQWKRSKKDKPKTTYKTVDEVLAEQTATEKDTVQVVLDMRGPHVKVTSLDKITTSTTTGWTPTQAQSSLPELQHNVKLLVELTETDIHRLNRELKHAKDTMSNLENERDELETRVIQEENTIRKTEECLAVIEQLQETLKSIASLGNSLSARFDAIAAFIDTIHHHYPHETRIYHLSTYAFTLVTPLFKALFHTWEPLIPSSTTSTEHVLEILQRWKMLLSGETSSRSPITSSSSDDLYGRILHELLLPKLQLCISTQWIPRDQQQSHLLTSLLSSLHPILPSDMYHQLIATLILPKLKNAIDIWNPRTDAIPIHTWVEPWSTVIPEEPMRPLYHIIRTKLAIVLQAWHPADTSALTVISPWLRVWSSHDVDQFLTRSIIPKLTSMLATDLVINPKAQVVTPFTQLMSWQPVMPSRMMIHILYEYFFPKWLTALTTWLSSDPDFEEVSKWYLGWKHLFPESLRELPAIKIIFNKSLDLMNHALQNISLENIMQQIYGILQNELQSRRTNTTTTSVGPSPTELARIAAEERARTERIRQQQQREREAAEEVDNMSIKEVMSSYATLNHLEFVPNLKRGLQDGKQVYLFGKISVYTSGQNIYAYDPTTSTWQPISLPELLTRAQNMANK